MRASITAEGLGVRFAFDRQRRPVTPVAARVRRHITEAWGLREIGLRVGPGETVALIGSNGAGKTTLLRVFAGVLSPDAGRVEVSGRIAPLLSVDAGLMPLLTGRESSRLLGVLAGLDRARSGAALEEVKRRSALGDAFERPVASYSQGMRARLGFATLDQVRPHVLLLDEVHEAVDHEFRAVLEQRAREVAGEGGIVVAAGHDHAALAELCGRAVLLEGGRVRDDGPFAQVAARYLGPGPDASPAPDGSLHSSRA